MKKVSQRTKKILPSLDFIAGVVSSHGNFGWIKKAKSKSPFFQIKIHLSDLSLLQAICMKLGLSGQIYQYHHQGRHYALLVVRRKSTLEQIIIPAFESRLFGVKQKQFKIWRKQFYQLWLAKLYPHITAV